MRRAGKHKLVSKETTAKIDRIVTHRVWGVPLFFVVMFITFEATFSLGAYPMEWIEQGVSALGGYVDGVMDSGPFRDLLVDGVIGGVGGVIVFLPNILILYLLISIMEESGYMSRAAMIMDKSMRRIGLHGKSFIPLIMGFGCNVPAIVATSSIESRSSRLITIFVNPFMSCSARLPVYILLAGTFFPNHSGLILFGLYLLGIVLAVTTAIIMRKILFRGERRTFQVELSRYALPSIVSALTLMWDKSWQYLRKMGGLILIASVAVWFLSYYPRNESVSLAQQQQNSYMGRVGIFCEPVMKPLGLEWKANVALISGVAAKELIVSTLGVLYAENNIDESASSARLSAKITSIDPHTGKSDFTPISALAFMVFVLIYFPCVASLSAISFQSGSWKWAVVSMAYCTILAWVCAFVTYQIGSIL